MAKEKIVKHRIVRVEKKIWGPDDTYLQIDPGKVQVFESDGWKEGDRVLVRIEIVPYSGALSTGDL